MNSFPDPDDARNKYPVALPAVVEEFVLRSIETDKFTWIEIKVTVINRDENKTGSLNLCTRYCFPGSRLILLGRRLGIVYQKHHKTTKVLKPALLFIERPNTYSSDQE